jgi:hypothetical protein
MSWLSKATGIHISTHGVRVSWPNPIGAIGDAAGFVTMHQSHDPALMRPTGPLKGPSLPFAQPNMPATNTPYTNGSGVSAPTIKAPTPVKQLPSGTTTRDTTPTNAGTGTGAGTGTDTTDPWQAFLAQALAGMPAGGGTLGANELDTTPYSTVPSTAPASSHWMLWLVVLAIMGGGYYFYTRS